jgi:hypothetical protein
VIVHLLTTLKANATFKLWMRCNLLDTCNKIKNILFVYIASFKLFWELLLVRFVVKFCVRDWISALYFLICDQKIQKHIAMFYNKYGTEQKCKNTQRCSTRHKIVTCIKSDKKASSLNIMLRLMLSISTLKMIIPVSTIPVLCLWIPWKGTTFGNGHDTL